jgi:hypothetical protein
MTKQQSEASGGGLGGSPPGLKQEVAMKTQAMMHADQLEKFAHFLDEHPGFSPELTGENALVCGFHIGGCFLTIEDMDRLIASHPHFDATAKALLLASPGASARGW